MGVISFGTEYDKSTHELKGRVYTPPTPSYNSLAQTASALVKSARTASGKVVGSRVGKRNISKLEINWNILSAKDWSDICKATKGASDTNILFYVKYFDMEANDFKIRRCYAGDKKAKPFRMDNTGRVSMWSNCLVNLIDAGDDMGEANA